MRPVDFTTLSKHSELALSLTRDARGLDREKARKVGEAAALILHRIVREFARSRRYTG